MSALLNIQHEAFSLAKRVCVFLAQPGLINHHGIKVLKDFDKDGVIHIESFESTDDGFRLAFRGRGKWSHLLVVLDSMNLKDIADRHYSEPLITNSKRVATASTEWTGDVGGTLDFERSFEEVKSRSKSLEKTIGAAVSTTVGTPEGSPVNVEATVETSVEETIAEELGTEESTAVTVTRSVEVKDGENLSCWAERSVSDESQLVTGRGAMGFSIQVGDHWDRKWYQNAKWASWAEFGDVLNGEGTDDIPLGSFFRKHPIQQDAIDKLLAPMNLPFRDRLEYEGVDDYKFITKDSKSGAVTIDALLPHEIIVKPSTPQQE